MLLPALLLSLSLAPAYAQDDDDDFSFLEEGEAAAAKAAKEGVSDDDFNALDMEGDDDFADFAIAPKPQPKAERSQRLPFDAKGKATLSDSYGAKVVYTHDDSVTVELPVLLSAGGELPGGAFWLVTEVWAGSAKVGETRQYVDAPMLARKGPSVAFVKVLVPVPGRQGELELRVGKAQDAGDIPTALFTSTVGYSL